MGTVKRSSKLDDRLPHEWNLDFLTPDEKASIKPVLEFAERKIVFYDIGFVRVAKQHYLEDRGYTRSDIFLIADWLEDTIKYLQKTPSHGSEETLQTLLQVKQKFMNEGILEDPAEEEPPVNLDFLTLNEKKFVLEALDSFVRTIKSSDLRQRSIIARRHVLDDRDYTMNDIKVIVLSLGMLKNLIKTSLPSLEGAEVESIMELPERAEIIKEKIKQEYNL